MTGQAYIEMYRRMMKDGASDKSKSRSDVIGGDIDNGWCYSKKASANLQVRDKNKNIQ